MKRILVLAAILAALSITACTPETTAGTVQRKDAAIVGTQNQIYQESQPVPVFNYSQQRATLIEVYKAKTAGTATYSVVYSFGKPVFVCPSIGFPIPATTQLTASESPVRVQLNPNSSEASSFVLPQAEPDGTYTGTSAATYILCVRADGSVSPVYAEPDVMTFTYPVKIVDGAVVDAGGASTVKVDVKKP